MDVILRVDSRERRVESFSERVVFGEGAVGAALIGAKFFVIVEFFGPDGGGMCRKFGF